MRLRSYLIGIVLLSGFSAVHARPVLKHASPASGSAVHKAPSQVSLSFSEALVPTGTDAVVRSASGGIVSSGRARVVSKMGEIKVPLKPLSAGTYKVEWYATSTNNQHAQGSYHFGVSSNVPERGPGGRHLHKSRH